MAVLDPRTTDRERLHDSSSTFPSIHPIPVPCKGCLRDSETPELRSARGRRPSQLRRGPPSLCASLWSLKHHGTKTLVLRTPQLLRTERSFLAKKTILLLEAHKIPSSASHPSSLSESKNNASGGVWRAGIASSPRYTAMQKWSRNKVENEVHVEESKAQHP